MKRTTKYLSVLTVAAVCLFLVVHIYTFIAYRTPPEGGQDLSHFQVLLWSLEHFFKVNFFVLLIIISAIWSLFFWISMLADCAKRDFEQPNDRLVWVLIIIFTGLIGATIYHFVVRKKSAKSI